MSRLIDDLLSLSRLEMRAHLAVNESVDVAATLAHVADTLTPLAAGLGVTIERHLPEHPVHVMGARDELIQVFQNLVENACKYGQEGKRVIIRLSEEDTGNATEVVASIQDFGPGIAAEHLPRLTERFYRIDVETSRAHKGTGLGLAIVKHILARHRGRLVVRSQLGKALLSWCACRGRTRAPPRLQQYEILQVSRRFIKEKSRQHFCYQDEAGRLFRSNAFGGARPGTLPEFSAPGGVRLSAGKPGANGSCNRGWLRPIHCRRNGNLR